jgi:hypothetical protein
MDLAIFDVRFWHEADEGTHDPSLPLLALSERATHADECLLLGE